MSEDQFPDPMVSANVYCSGQLDRLIGEAVAPFWNEFGSQDDFTGCYLWFLRYDKLGEHLKIRLHGPEHLQETAARKLREAIEPVLSNLPPAASAGSAERPSFSFRVPPIDAEDSASKPPPDRTMVFTQYRRSAVSLGPYPYVEDDGYLAAVTRCLGLGAQEVLSTAAEDGGSGLASRRQSCLLGLLIAGLAPLGLETNAYLRYHRDWLIRFPLLKSNATDEHGREMLRRFERFCEGRAEQLQILQQWTSDVWAECSKEDGQEPATAEPTFYHAVASLLFVLNNPSSTLPESIDPHTERLAFPLLFKVLHGLANQVGISRFEEAFTAHLLLRATSPESLGDVHFSLLPFAKGLT